jgi:hypothetical protein
MPRGLELLLTAAATAVALAFFASVPYWPREGSANAIRLPTFAPAAVSYATPAPVGPLVLASLKPVPVLNLELPADLATVVRRTGINGETGLIPTFASITTFRLRATGDLVTVAAPTGIDAVRRPPGDVDPAIAVHGSYALASVDRGSTVIRWTENGVTYEVSSRTLDANRLAEVAEKLR